jgi:predicted metalloprotease
MWDLRRLPESNHVHTGPYRADSRGHDSQNGEVPARSARSLLALLVALVLSAGLTACGDLIAGTPSPGDGIAVNQVDTGFINGTDGGRIDQLAAATVIDVQSYWQRTFLPTFGAGWRDVRQFYSVDTNDETAKPPPCTEKAKDLEGNAFYCPNADAIAWDRAALLPVLADKFGEAGVVVVLAHEIGHAVHNRLGVTTERQRREPDKYPTIVVEAMADCYAGAFVRWVVDGQAEHLRIAGDQLDLALGALVNFRDPVGTSSADRRAHGNAFDRVSSFSDGYQQGPKLCSQFTAQSRQFTLREFTNVADEARGGNLSLTELLKSLTKDLDKFFGGMVRAQGGTWKTPQTRFDVNDAACTGDQGPVAFCQDSATIGTTAGGELGELHRRIGDYAAGTLVTSRYGLAAIAALGKPVQGEAAGRAALCLAGGYTGELLNRSEGFELSPGDLDEAVLVLLRNDYAARDAAGDSAAGSGFDRVGVFRGGALDGAESCRLG